jgi:hypothetical protein
MMHYTDVEQWKSDLKERYGGECGAVVANSLAMLYSNWHGVRTDRLKEVKERFTTGTLTNIDVVDKTVKEVKDKVQGNVATLKDLVSNISDPDAGILIGANCKAIGESVVEAKDAVCARSFNSVYKLLLVLTICSFAMLFALCFIVFSSIRQEYIDGDRPGDGGSPCCNKSSAEGGYEVAYSEPEPVRDAPPGVDPYELGIRRIQSGAIRYSGSPSTAIDSRLYPRQRESMRITDLERGAGGALSFLASEVPNQRRTAAARRAIRASEGLN